MGDFDDRKALQPSLPVWSVSKEYRSWLADQEGGEKYRDRKTGKWVSAIDPKTGRWMPYQDDAGHWTIGRGHLINGGRSPRGFERGLTPSQVDDLFIKDVASHTEIAQKLFANEWDDMPDRMRELAVDFAYSFGDKARSKYPSMWKAVLKGDMAEAIKQSDRHANVGGVMKKMTKRNKGTREFFFGQQGK